MYILRKHSQQHNVSNTKIAKIDLTKNITEVLKFVKRDTILNSNFGTHLWSRQRLILQLYIAGSQRYTDNMFIYSALSMHPNLPHFRIFDELLRWINTTFANILKAQIHTQQTHRKHKGLQKLSFFISNKAK